MARYYFHVQDGVTIFDDEGMEFSNIEAAQDEAIQSTGDMLRNMQGPKFWAGEPWKLWVTDQPNGGGNTIFTLVFAGQLAS